MANFQETAVFRVHLTGALLAFGVGSVYLWTQASISAGHLAVFTIRNEIINLLLDSGIF